MRGSRKKQLTKDFNTKDVAYHPYQPPLFKFLGTGYYKVTKGTPRRMAMCGRGMAKAAKQAYKDVKHSST